MSLEPVYLSWRHNSFRKTSFTKSIAIMRRTQPRESLLYNVRSWAEDIPLGSLDQLQQVGGHSHPSRGDADNSTSIPLPASKESSIRDTGLEDFRRAQIDEHFALDGQSQLRSNCSEVTDVPLPESRLDAADALSVPLPELSGLGTDRASSGAASTVNSLAQLQTARIPVLQQSLQPNAAEAFKVPLPGSSGLGTDGPSYGSGLTIDSLAQLQTAKISTLEPLHRPDTVEGLDVPLPRSSGLGDDGCSSGVASPVDSLAQLQRATTSAPAERLANQPTSRRNKRPTKRPTKQTYWENIKPLTQILPHLEAIQPPNGRHQRVGRLKSIDYFNDGTAPQIGISLELDAHFNQHHLVTELRKLKKVEDDVASRMVVVEDLCSELIGALGLAFDLDPEFFAEHLNRSGYSGADHEDFAPDRWKTAHLRKDYTSMTWMRPVYQSERMAKLLQTPEAILDTRKEYPDLPLAMANNAAVWRDAKFNDKGEPDGNAMKHTPLVDTNIFRRSWLLSGRSVSRADFRDLGGEAQSDASSQSESSFTNKQKEAEFLPAAWEERVSFCYYGEDTGMPIGMHDSAAILSRLSMFKSLTCSRHNSG